MTTADLNDYRLKFNACSASELLRELAITYGRRLALASSLGAEDQVLTDMLLKIMPDARIFIIDTGRLPQETYATIAASMRWYNFCYEIYCPDTKSLETMESESGPNFFYESVANRKHCCQVRKVQPLQRVLQTLDLWVTGLRRQQSPTRATIDVIEWDETNQLLKANPLADWSTEAVWQYIREHHVPYNPLHDQNYASIGCAPCTRAIAPGEDLRAGRWWWEEPEHKECGLHYRDGKLVRENHS